jgi:hypothetical protein
MDKISALLKSGASVNANLLQLELALIEIKQSPKTSGVLNLIVRRPSTGAREILQEATLDTREGLLGDNWNSRSKPNLDCQLTVMNSRAAAAVAREPEAWPAAGDQLYIDMDLSADNLPPGTRLQIGSAVIEVTAFPHAGCKKFKVRFGADALAFVNSTEGLRLRLRGLNARVIQSGVIRAGEIAQKLPGGPMAQSPV